MGKTHAKGGQVAALGGYLWLQNSGVMSQVPVPGYVGLLIIYPFAVWASTAPDLDHGKNSAPGMMLSVKQFGMCCMQLQI